MSTAKIARLAALVFLGVPAFAQYSGPAILSRGDAPSAMEAPQIDFIPFLSVIGVYDTGLNGVSVNSQGQLANAASEGVEVDFGISGVHSWKHTKVSLNYAGSATDYSQANYYSSLNQSLMLGISHDVSKHVSLRLSETAGMFGQTYGLVGLSPTVPFDPSTTYTPTTDFFDNRTIYADTKLMLTYQRTARLSLAFSGDWDLTRRRSTALYGVTGEDASGDLQYRLTRRSTLGANYMFTHFGYNGLFGGSDFHRFSATYGVQLTKSWEFTGFAGVARTDSEFPQVVALDPVIAALLGVSQGLIVSHNVNWLPVYSVRLSKTFVRGVAYLGGGHVMTPGNGLFLTSSDFNASLGYTYTGLRRWAMNFLASYDRQQSIANLVGEYGDISAGLQTSRQISHMLHMVAGISARKYESSSFSAYNRVIWDARAGITWSPRDIPLRIW